jgi:septation ring formation regulator EzrA
MMATIKEMKQRITDLEEENEGLKEKLNALRDPIIQAYESLDEDPEETTDDDDEGDDDE